MLERSADVVPVLTTRRLRLRAHHAGDLGAAVAMWSDPIVTRFTSGKASSEQQTWTRITSYAGHWRLMGYGYWAIEHAATGAFVGEVGFADFKRPLEPRMRDVPELGFALASPFHRQGYASEAVEIALRWGDAQLHWQRTVCLAMRENAASMKLVARLGYVVFGAAEVNGAAVQLMERPSPYHA